MCYAYIYAYKFLMVTSVSSSVGESLLRIHLTFFLPATAVSPSPLSFLLIPIRSYDTAPKREYKRKEVRSLHYIHFPISKSLRDFFFLFLQERKGGRHSGHVSKKHLLFPYLCCKIHINNTRLFLEREKSFLCCGVL